MQFQPQHHPIIIKIYTVLYVIAHHSNHSVPRGREAHRSDKLTNVETSSMPSWLIPKLARGSLLFFPVNFYSNRLGVQVDLCVWNNELFGIAALCIICMCSSLGWCWFIGINFLNRMPSCSPSLLSPCVPISHFPCLNIFPECMVSFLSVSQWSRLHWHWDTYWLHILHLFQKFSLLLSFTQA